MIFPYHANTAPHFNHVLIIVTFDYNFKIENTNKIFNKK